MRSTSIARAVACVALILGTAYSASARSLSDQIDSLFGEGGILLDVHSRGPFPSHAAHFSSASLTALGLLVKQLAPSAADFPAISTAPGITYRYNFQLQAFERSSTSLGPIFVERPQTVGRGKLDLGFSYLFVDFDELNGKDIDRLAFTLHHNPVPGSPPFVNDTIDILFNRFTLQSQVVSFYATYGVTNRWDINLLVPIVFTSLRLRAQAHINDTTQPPIHFFNNELQTTTEVQSASGDKSGFGDLLLRTKYHFFDANGFNLAAGLALRVPTGNEDNFQGLGDTTLTPFVALSQEYGRFDLHASSGIEINFEDSDRSRVRYGGGVTVQLIERLAIVADVIGSSNLQTDRISLDVPVFPTNPQVFPPSPSGFTRVHQSLSTDIVDISVGFKANLYSTMVGFAAAIVPLNDDGLRADVIPTAGLEVSF
ncbi:MAG TPA: transporter [Candidatus Binatia bacterium]|nr:transporter [Candidatus Binatia bacterium]